MVYYQFLLSIISIDYLLLALLMKHYLARESSYFFTLLFILLCVLIIGVGQHYLSEVVCVSLCI